MKTERQRIILELVSAGGVHNQDELQSLLGQRGMAVTQTTLSRDVNALGLVKRRCSDGSLCYSPRPSAPATPSTTADGIVSVEFSGSQAVLKTHPGFASVVASTIDRASVRGVMGTIAGDDTILMILRQDADRAGILSSLEAILPGVRNKIYNI